MWFIFVGTNLRDRLCKTARVPFISLTFISSIFISSIFISSILIFLAFDLDVKLSFRDVYVLEKSTWISLGR